VARGLRPGVSEQFLLQSHLLAQFCDIAVQLGDIGGAVVCGVRPSVLQTASLNEIPVADGTS
jgi:hypothetical protein